MSAPRPAAGVPDEPDIVRLFGQLDTRLRLVQQAIVDLQRGTVVGFEQLARIGGPPDAGPDRWFAAASRAGRAAELSAEVVRRTLAVVDHLPADTFVTVNLEPADLTAPAVLEALSTRPRLDRVVLEITEHALVEDFDLLARAATPLRARGARIAADDVGAGYSGLRALHAMRPDIVKLDRWLVDHIDADPAKRMVVAMLGRAADALDAWVLAEGIERPEELDVLVDLGVPLGQGYLLGRPRDGYQAGIDPDLAERLQRRAMVRDLGDHVAQLVVEVPTVAAGTHALSGPAIEVDGDGRPVALHLPGGERTTQLVIAKPSEPVAALARRAVNRADGRWSDPLVVVDGHGELLGVVPVAALLERLARG